MYTRMPPSKPDLKRVFTEPHSSLILYGYNRELTPLPGSSMSKALSTGPKLSLMLNPNKDFSFIIFKDFSFPTPGFLFFPGN